MKLNLPSTLTQQQAWTLFFLTLLHLKCSEAGNAFRNCLAVEHNDTTSYDKLLNYPFPVGDLGKTPDYYLDLCCIGSQCQSRSPGMDCTDTFLCSRIGGKIACTFDDWTKNSYDQYYDLKRVCVGIIGSEAITANAVDRQDDNHCAKINVSMIGDLTNNCLKTITPVGLDKGYAYYKMYSVCPNSVRGSLSDLGGLYFCNWDNQGMVCTDGFTCWLQFSAPWPGLAEQNPMPIKTSNDLPIPEDNHLIEKIAIPVGSISGTGILSFLTYYFCKKKKNQKKLMIKDNIQSENQGLKNEVIELNESYQDNLYLKIEKNNSSSDQKLELEENNQLETLTISSSSISNQPTIINQLRMKLITHQQLWTDYLDVSNLVVNNPSSQFILNQLNNLQAELLKILTIGEIKLLLENNHSYRNNPQTEYTETIEQANNPQWIPTSNNPQQIVIIRNPEWRG